MRSRSRRRRRGGRSWNEPASARSTDRPTGIYPGESTLRYSITPSFPAPAARVGDCQSLERASVVTTHLLVETSKPTTIESRKLTRVRSIRMIPGPSLKPNARRSRRSGAASASSSPPSATKFHRSSEQVNCVVRTQAFGAHAHLRVSEEILRFAPRSQKRGSRLAAQESRHRA